MKSARDGTEHTGEKVLAKEKNPAEAAPPMRTASENHLGWKLFLLGFLTLFLELFFIRYLAGSVWNLGYFPNLVLMSTFIGMGVGFVFHNRLDLRQSARVFQIAFAIAVALIVFVSYQHPVVPGFGTWDYNLDGDLYFTSVPFKVDDLNYLFFVLCFLTVIFIFAGLSQRTAKVFREFAPLNAYTLDILGSCAGILTFIGISALQFPAYSWFAIFTILFIFAMPSGWKVRLIPLSLSIIAVTVMLRQDRSLMQNPKSTSYLETYWSPYQKIEYVEDPPAPNQPDQKRRRILVNGLDHQEMSDHLTNTFYFMPYAYREDMKLPRVKDVLVIGAGSGNDVTTALLNGATHIDAVEIDPVIARLGRAHNPSRAYFDPRVHLHITDGRAFMTQTQRKYDLIIFALTDSMVKVSSMTQLRLENYLFTRESVGRAYELLNDGGNVVFYNYYRLPFVAEKIQEMIGQATGSLPTVLYQNNGFYMVSGQKQAGSIVHPYTDPVTAAMPTDDWPFLYLERHEIPKVYRKAIFGVSCLIAALLAALQWSTRKTKAQQARGSLRIKIAFAFMGIAFLLLETKSVIQFSLLFGTTWLNNSLIFLAALISVLAANWTVQWLKDARLIWLFFVLLVVSVVSSFIFPLHNLLHIQGILPRLVAASIMTFSPIYFANLIFSSLFKDQETAEHLFGWNLLGATVGGVLEYSSMALGYNALSIIIIGCYTLVFVLLLTIRKRTTASPVWLPSGKRE